MNKSALKKYAPQARLDFITSVTRRAELLGLNPESPANVEKQGEALLINGRAFPVAYGQMRNTLEARIRDQGFVQVMEAMAYTWFNRLVAIRYMELHGFLDHGYRVLSHPANEDTGHTQPEILDHIPELDLPDFDKEQALELKLAGNRDEELYREVLLAQCHALHQAMPFLFESLDDATELLLPDGLLRTDSILGKLVTAIDEADWQDVEIIGWLYQFYISEKKDQVIGKVVKSEDIPAATQLFTPNWIVKYLVQNSLGRLWLMANPTSQLGAKWEYYIQPAEQTPEVNAQLDTLIQARIAEDGTTLNPESLTLLDPACGSGHILVEAYDLLRDIYLERGYRRQDIPRLILEKNLYGLDIDDRAAQLAGFALLMKARADDRRLFGQPVDLNVLALQEAKEGGAADLHGALNAPQIDYATVVQLVKTFEQAKTFGSLIQIPDELASALPDLRRGLETVRGGGDMLGRDAAATLLRLVAQAGVLAKQFDAVVANPPYMGSKYYCPELMGYVKSFYPSAKPDLYACFIQASLLRCKPCGSTSQINIPGWMMNSTFSEFREQLLSGGTIVSLIHNGRGIFGADFGSCAFTILANLVEDFRGVYRRLFDKPSIVYSIEELSQRFHRAEEFHAASSAFRAVPDAPISYQVPDDVRSAFNRLAPLSELTDACQGLSTSDDGRFVRYWHEIDMRKSAIDQDMHAGSVNPKWFPYNKGGSFRKWFGNIEHVINWSNGGQELKDRRPSSVIRNEKNYFKESISWQDYTVGKTSFRYYPEGFIFATNAHSAFVNEPGNLAKILGFCNSAAQHALAAAICPGHHFNSGYFSLLPFPVEASSNQIVDAVTRLVAIAREDWDTFEESWDFSRNPLVNIAERQECALSETYRLWDKACHSIVDETRSLESDLDRHFVRACNLDIETPEQSDPAEVTLKINPVHRFGDQLPKAERDLRFKEACSKELTSFSIGCMMGRYSLDAPGLIYAHSGNEGFDPSRYETFPADDDGIVPITDEAWFDDDGANRIREFVRVVWGEETEAENMAWLAESLGQKASESADDTIRRYLSKGFYKDHLQTYKKRPIYWLFSSGKHKAFEALVYLHRYNAGTLSRMRMEYVVPLQSRMQSRIDNLDQDIQSSTSSAEQKRFQKQKDKLIKQLDELRRFDENLRHYADQRITLDLDDGVKVNYGKFGDLLAEVKAVTGKK
ncbi:MAG: BREX-1 system adenine-specific DNA-methyltransferase PglX [Pseudomonadales bacterium]|nr:BREX-1 system adenine-specific DNA-methyltransferase PglX [Pseudomonadales bacterium]